MGKKLDKLAARIDALEKSIARLLGGKKTKSAKPKKKKAVAKPKAAKSKAAKSKARPKKKKAVKAALPAPLAATL